MTKIIIGCSYIQLMKIEQSPFENFIPIGMGGCDNKTIYNTIIEAKKLYNPTYIFVSFTGLNRVSYPISKYTSKLFNDYDYFKQNENEVRLFSGGTYGSWVNYKKLHDIFKLTYFDKKIDHVMQNSLIDCISTIAFLETNKIKYNYTFAYDPTDSEDDNSHLWGSLNDSLKYYWDLLNKEHYFSDIHLYNFARKNSLMIEDNLHPNTQAYNFWFNCVNKNLKLC